MEDHDRANLTDAIKALSQKAQAVQIAKEKEERVRILIELTSASFDKSSAYAHVIILAGYAGILTTWSLTKEHLSTTGNATVGLLLGVSIILFLRLGGF